MVRAGFGQLLCFLAVLLLLGACEPSGGRELRAELAELNQNYIPNIDLDGDGLDETVLYDPLALQLKVYRGKDLISATGVPEFGMIFNYIGTGRLFSYSYSFVRDREDEVLLHTTSRTLFDDSNDIVVSCSHDYHAFRESEWIVVHSIRCTEINGTSYESVTMDGQPVDSLESALSQFTELDGSYYEIPPGCYEEYGWNYVDEYYEANGWLTA